MADSSFISDNRNGLRRFGYCNFGNNNACNDFNGIYATEINYPSNALHLVYRTENGSYYCRNRIDIIIHIITIK